MSAAEFEVVENKKGKALIWKFFGLKNQGGTIINNEAVCKSCSMTVKYSGGTSNLNSHMRAHHPSVFIEPAKSAAKTKNKTNIAEPSDKQTAQPSISSILASKEKYSYNSKRAEVITSTITDFLIQDMRPFHTVETTWFRRMVNTLDPKYTVPSRKQFSSIIIPKKYDELKTTVKTNLSKAKQVAITTDGWTSRATESFITVTSTHINDEWEMVNYVLMTRAMPDSHTGQNIADFLKAALAEWDIPLEPLYLVSDNAANMKKAGEILKCELHLGCFAHVLNLAAQRGLRVKQVSNVLAKIRRTVGFFHRSSVAASLLKTNASNLDVPTNKLIIDVSTRWNSAFDMLERYLQMHVAVFATLMSKELTNKDKDLKLLTDDELLLAEKVKECMKPLKTATTMLCSEKHPTVTVIHPLYNKLLRTYMNANNDDMPAISALKSAIAGDLEGRYNKHQKVLLLATALDPRFKDLQHLNDKERFDVYNDLISEISQSKVPVMVKQESIDTPDSQTEALPALPGVPSLIKEPSPSAPKKPKLEQESSALSDLLGDVFVTKVEAAVSPLKQAADEVQKYREMPASNLSVDPLTWWRDNQYTFPMIASVARKLLCIPSTSVPSERVFSSAGDIVSAQRACLKAKCVDQLIF